MVARCVFVEESSSGINYSKVMWGDITGVVNGMEDVSVLDARRKAQEINNARGPPRKGDKAWILNKKEQMAKKGKVVKNTSKFTGRKRRIAF